MYLGRQTIKGHLSNRFRRLLVRPDVSGCHIKKGVQDQMYKIKMFEGGQNKQVIFSSESLKTLTCMCIVNQEGDIFQTYLI